MNRLAATAATLMVSAMLASPAAADRPNAQPHFPLAADPASLQASSDACDFRPFDCALRLIEQRRTQAALPLLRRSATRGSGTAMRAIGLIYLRGEGDTAQDLAQAVRWLQAGARRGDAESMYTLGVMYQRGYAVEANLAQAITWLSRAADHGYAPASAALSSLN